jgi:hypothetical protein
MTVTPVLFSMICTAHIAKHTLGQDVLISKCFLVHLSIYCLAYTSQVFCSASTTLHILFTSTAQPVWNIHHVLLIICCTIVLLEYCTVARQREQENPGFT